MSKRSRFQTPTDTSDAIDKLIGEKDEINSSLELVQISRIELDPNQPRRLGLSRDNLRAIPEGNERLKEELEALEELSQQIGALGLVQPIGVYRYGSGFRLAWGERRLLASQLLGLTSIRAEILSERPKNIRAKQLIENLGRRDLSLADRLHGIRNFLTECENTDHPIITAADFQQQTGIKRTNAYACFALLSAPSDVAEAIENHRLNDLREAYRIASIDTPTARELAIAQLVNGGVVNVPLPEVVPAKALVKPAKKVGRPLKSVSLKFSSGNVARFVVSKLLDDKSFAIYKSANWDDMRVAADILGQVIKKLEKQMAPKKTDGK
jgi:ParB/RepB/Spo0J family partition protein